MFFFLVGMNANEDVKKQRLKQQFLPVSSEASYDSCSFHKSDTNDVEVEEASETYENKQHVKEDGGETKIKGWYISLTPSTWTTTNGLPKWTT